MGGKLDDFVPYLTSNRSEIRKSRETRLHISGTNVT